MKLNNDQYNELVEKLGEELAMEVFEKEAGEFSNAVKGLFSAEKARFSTGNALRKAKGVAAQTEKDIAKKNKAVGAESGSRLERDLEDEARKKRGDALGDTYTASGHHSEATRASDKARKDLVNAVPGTAKKLGAGVAIGAGAAGAGYAAGNYSNRKTAAEVLAEELLKEADYKGVVKNLASAERARFSTGNALRKAKGNAAQIEKDIKKSNKRTSGLGDSELDQEIKNNYAKRQTARRNEALGDTYIASGHHAEAARISDKARKDFADAVPKPSKGTLIGAGIGAAGVGGGIAYGSKSHAKAAAEALIEGLLYKEAAENDMFNADLVAEASEMALNAYGYSRIEE